MIIKAVVTAHDILNIYEYGQTFWIVEYSDRAYELLKKQNLTVSEIQELDKLEADLAETEYGHKYKQQIVKRIGVVYNKEAEKCEALSPSFLLILVKYEED